MNRKAALDNYFSWANRDRVVTEVGDPRSEEGISEQTYEQQARDLPDPIREVQAPRPPPMRPNFFEEINAKLGGLPETGALQLAIPISDVPRLSQPSEGAGAC